MDDSSRFTWHFHITGRVQGIGFRPHVYRIAESLNIKGTVSNDVDGVHIVFNSTQKAADDFVSDILKAAPSLSRIISSRLQKTKSRIFDDFKIIQKEETAQSQIAITPDFALCQECKTDLKHSRRLGYPFISCSQCGPRYSISKKLPFDRQNTSMNSFVMCDSCTAEYQNHTDRRFYAQTISCPTCPISQQLYKNDKSLVSSDTAEILSMIPTLWNEGKIVAIKGIGGFLLTCAANQASVVQELRVRKNRPTKPFAVMIPYPDYYSTKQLSSIITEELSGHISPVILCPKDHIPEELKHVADDLDTLGIMIPYAPIFQLLLDIFKQPIIATSGNISNSPIIFENEKALEQLPSIADYILVNDREIKTAQDDSVVKFSQLTNQKIILRRSRGMAPNYLEAYKNQTQNSVLCLGAELKSTFCISHLNQVYISQYIGNLLNFETQKHYSYILDNFLSLIQASPTHICVDAHPAYATHHFADELAQRFNIPITKIQHHKAHFASILGEHKLIDSSEKIVGVIWDGTGLGEDQMIWGSEFFVFEHHKMTRCAHLDYYTHFLSDKMALEPRISAFSILHSQELALDFIKDKFTDEEWKIYTSLIDNDTSLKTSSMGRLFDAAASILGILDKQTYEGEAAMMLEVAARKHISSFAISELGSYVFSSSFQVNANPTIILLQMIEDLRLQHSIELIAAKFHLTLVKWIIAVAKSEDCTSVAFSGGVFQNSVLIDLIYTIYGGDYTVYFHEELSPNDENISFGQYIYFKITEKLMEKN